MPTLLKVFTAARSKIETAAWFARRPTLYRELARRALGFRVRTAHSLDAEKQAKREGTAWCVENQRPLGQVLLAVDTPVDVRPVGELNPARWAQAADQFRRCGGKMGGPAHVDLLHHLVLHRRPDVVVETGVAAGWSSLAVLSAMDQNEHGRLISVDMPYPKRDADHLVGCVVPDVLRTRWTLLRLPDRDALPRIVRANRIALAHYDSDKSYEGRMFGYRILFDALEPGGLLVSDDVEDNLAFRDFAISVAREPWVFAKSSDNFAGLIVR